MSGYGDPTDGHQGGTGGGGGYPPNQPPGEPRPPFLAPLHMPVSDDQSSAITDPPPSTSFTVLEGSLQREMPYDSQPRTRPRLEPQQQPTEEYVHYPIQQHGQQQAHYPQMHQHQQYQQPTYPSHHQEMREVQYVQETQPSQYEIETSPYQHQQQFQQGSYPQQVQPTQFQDVYRPEYQEVSHHYGTVPQQLHYQDTMGQQQYYAPQQTQQQPHYLDSQQQFQQSEYQQQQQQQQQQHQAQAQYQPPQQPLQYSEPAPPSLPPSQSQLEQPRTRGQRRARAQTAPTFPSAPSAPTALSPQLRQQQQSPQQFQANPQFITPFRLPRFYYPGSDGALVLLPPPNYRPTALEKLQAEINRLPQPKKRSRSRVHKQTSTRQQAPEARRDSLPQQQPSTSHPRPSTSQSQPSTSYQRPPTSQQQPSTSYQQPATSQPQPATSQPQSSTSQPRSSAPEPQPATSQPSTSQPQPTTPQQFRGFLQPGLPGQVQQQQFIQRSPIPIPPPFPPPSRVPRIKFRRRARPYRPRHSMLTAEQQNIIHQQPNPRVIPVKGNIDEYLAINKSDFTFCDGLLWNIITYHEFGARLGDSFNARLPTIFVDGYTYPLASNRLCLGAISNPNRQPYPEWIRARIGRGVVLHYKNGDLYMQALAGYDLYVSDPLRGHVENGKLVEHIIKLKRGECQKVFSIDLFSRLLSSSYVRGWEAVCDMVNRCTVKASFAKGWGPNYRRKQITDCEVWIELLMVGPMQWVDRALRYHRRPAVMTCHSNT